ncbi:MAG: glycosyltransferase family 2 protein [Nonlabens sp.]|uniref:glycosyltransferase family 2 protein n=1 Tax=Nonlabens sp. TaxID=1888209 RepID=UPI003EF15B58
MDLSIIILNYNAAAFLELCLDSVFKAIKNINAEVIVVDNNSTDSSLQMLHFVYPQVKVIANEENVGFSQGNNIGVKHAAGTYLCILNPDTIVSETVFDEVLAFAKANPQIAFTTTQLIDGTGAFLPESKRNVPTPKIARQKILGNDSNYYSNHLEKDQNGEIEVLVGAMMVCRKSVYEELGGFDPMYFMYGEDIDLSYTALQKGYKNYYLGSEKVIHFKGESTIKDKKYLERFYGAMGLFYDKHFKKSKLEKTLVDLALKGIIATKSLETKSDDPINGKQEILVTGDKDFKSDLFEKTLDYEEILNCSRDLDMVIIWDTRTISYGQMIEFMASHTVSNITYRFLSPQRDFMLGSDSSSSRGSVTYLEL